MARRPKGYEGERYSEFLGLQLTPSQRRSLDNAAEASGMVVAELVRSYLPFGGSRVSRGV